MQRCVLKEQENRAGMGGCIPTLLSETCLPSDVSGPCSSGNKDCWVGLLECDISLEMAPCPVTGAGCWYQGHSSPGAGGCLLTSNRVEKSLLHVVC